jgi:AraC-like DNA-binding protein
MIGCGTNTFTDPDDYRRNVQGLNVSLVLTGSDTFRSDVTWVQLNHLRLVRISESASRIAFVSLVPESVFVSFPLHNDPHQVWNGVRMRRGEVVLHGWAEHFHQLTLGCARWGVVSVAPAQLRRFSGSLTGRDLVPPKTDRFLQMPSNIAGRFLRLHTQACDLVRSRPDLMAHREVARALEQDLIHALVDVLAVGEPHGSSASTRQRHAAIMARFEGVLATPDGPQLSTSALCAAIAVPERTLRMCCTEFVGRSPVSYARLRRLNLVRSALMRSDPSTASIATIAKAYGFSEAGRFAAAYRSVFGEAPSVTLRRSIVDSSRSIDSA